MRRLYVRLRKDGSVRARPHSAQRHSVVVRGTFEPDGSHSDAHSAGLDLETAWGGCRT
jgi:hypothetical protein